MKATAILLFSILALGLAGYVHPAQADSTQANCEVRKDGEKQKGKSGPCTFGQHQGSIDIDLRNGDTCSLKPTGNADHYKDQKGNKVVRTRAGGNTQEFKWEGGRKVVVTFNADSYGGNAYGTAGYGAASGSPEYQRGYTDAANGRPFDQNRHGQDYKDGFRAGEDSRGGPANKGNDNGNGDYRINRLSNGGFEVVWTKHGCIATFNSRGDAMNYSNGCNDSQISRSQEIARRER
jgi:hypothetical protein